MNENENTNNFLAAEQAWPWRNPGVASIRQTFLLPANQPLKN